MIILEVYMIWTVVALVIVWMYTRKKNSYFKDRGINHLPAKPFFGNMFNSMTQKEHFFETVNKAYRAFPNDRVVGHYEFIVPMTIVRDIELLKLIGIKDFDHFADHRPFSHEHDAFFSKSLIALKGQKWRDMRSTLSPAFTASKLRSMIPLMQECSKDLKDHLLAEVKKSKDGSVVADLRDLMPRYTNDVIATCAYGLKTNSIAERNNDFYKMGNLLTDFSIWQSLKFFISSSFPYLSEKLNLEIFSVKASNFFTKIFLGTMRQREENNTFRPDMLQLLMEAQKGTLTHDKQAVEEKDAGFATALESDIGKETVKQVWDDNHIVAQAILFFFAGFDTVSTVMTFLLHELAANPDTQDRLRQEIDELLEENKGKIDYEKINKMKYLDMCISETLRKWPPTGFVDRMCLKKYNMGKPNEKAPDYIIPAGNYLIIPIWSIHYDEKYYTNPQQFDPERFSDDNKHNITPSNYMPFGIGPRNCIGSRFALAEIKTMVIDILSHFELSPSSTTKLPLSLDQHTFNTRLEGGQNLKFTLRK